jgi:RHS repeat-associated protein
VRELVNAGDLATRARYDYDPYGQRTKLAGDLDADFGFTGHYEHAPSGLTLAPFRAYDSALGRWLSRDPIGEEGGINLYSYLESEPIQLVDLLGLMPSAKIGGNKVQVHRNDVDPWPSSPHGHIYDKNQVVDVHGNIYNKSTGKVVGHIGKKNLARLTQLFQKVGRRGGVVSIAFFLADASAQGAHVAATTALRSAFFLDEIAYIRNRLRGDVPGDPDDDGDGIPDLNDPDHPRYWDDIEFECRTTGRKTK